MRIIRESRLRKMLKEAYEKGLNIGSDIGYRCRKIDEGTIMLGYDMEKDIQEILKRKGANGNDKEFS